MGTENENAAFARRLRVARAWAGYSRQEDFGAALVERWPDWPVKSVVKRIELGLKDVGLAERALWAERLEEFAGVPRWFMLSGWEGAQAASTNDTFDELRQIVERHERILADRAGEDLATAAERSAEAAPQPGQLRAVPSAPKKRAPKK